MKVKELFLIGAPKCGTSALYHYLNSLDVFEGCTPKESNQWLEESHPLRKEYTLNPEVKNIYLEASPNNFYHPCEELLSKQYRDDVRFVLVLRDPVERLTSSFNYTKHNLGRIKSNFHLNDYVERILHDDYRWLETKVRGEVSQFVLRRDLDYGKYVKYLDAWNIAYEKNNLLILSQKELISSPQLVIDRILRHCSINKEIAVFPRIMNKTSSYKSQFLHRILYKLNNRFTSPPLLKKLYAKYFGSDSLDRITTDNKLKLHRYYKDSVSELRLKYNYQL